MINSKMARFDYFQELIENFAERIMAASMICEYTSYFSIT